MKFTPIACAKGCGWKTTAAAGTPRATAEATRHHPRCKGAR